eukprot:tig00020830_g14405.t1
MMEPRSDSPRCIVAAAGWVGGSAHSRSRRTPSPGSEPPHAATLDPLEDGDAALAERRASTGARSSGGISAIMARARKDLLPSPTVMLNLNSELSGAAGLTVPAAAAAAAGDGVAAAVQAAVESASRTNSADPSSEGPDETSSEYAYSVAESFRSWERAAAAAAAPADRDGVALIALHTGSDESPRPASPARSSGSGGAPPRAARAADSEGGRAARRRTAPPRSALAAPAAPAAAVAAGPAPVGGAAGEPAHGAPAEEPRPPRAHRRVGPRAAAPGPGPGPGPSGLAEPTDAELEGEREAPRAGRPEAGAAAGSAPAACAPSGPRRPCSLPPSPPRPDALPAPRARPRAPNQRAPTARVPRSASIRSVRFDLEPRVAYLAKSDEAEEEVDERAARVEGDSSLTPAASGVGVLRLLAEISVAACAIVALSLLVFALPASFIKYSAEPNPRSALNPFNGIFGMLIAFGLVGFSAVEFRCVYGSWDAVFASGFWAWLLGVLIIGLVLMGASALAAFPYWYYWLDAAYICVVYSSLALGGTFLAERRRGAAGREALAKGARFMLAEVAVAIFTLLYSFVIMPVYARVSDGLKIAWRVTLHPIYTDLLIVAPLRSYVYSFMVRGEPSEAAPLVHALSHGVTMGRIMLFSVDRTGWYILLVMLAQLVKVLLRSSLRFQDRAVLYLTGRTKGIRDSWAYQRTEVTNRDMLRAIHLLSETLIDHAMILVSAGVVLLFSRHHGQFMIPLPASMEGPETLVYYVAIQLLVAWVFDFGCLLFNAAYAKLPVFEVWREIKGQRARFLAFVIYGTSSMGLLGILYMTYMVPRSVYCSTTLQADGTSLHDCNYDVVAGGLRSHFG